MVSNTKGEVSMGDLTIQITSQSSQPILFIIAKVVLPPTAFNDELVNSSRVNG
jgi:hypothetical protein